MSPVVFLSIVGVAVLIIGGTVVMIAKFYRKVDQGKALIVNKMKAEPDVTFSGMTVFPIVHRAEVMDISVKTIVIDRKAKDGLICKDNIRADIKVTFFVRVNKTRQDVLKVAQSIGCVRGSDQQTLEELFSAKFSEALKTVGKRIEFEALYDKRDEFKDQILEVIGKDLNGYVLDDAAIDYLEQTPIEHLDQDNILDAQGIRKITDITTTQNVLTNDFRQTERKAIKKQNVEAEEAILELERQEKDARAKQSREVQTVEAREEAETKKVQAEEHLRAELARIKAEEEIAINTENKMRQVEVAQKNRERVIGVETERVLMDRQLEAIKRERGVELNRIDKEKALEVERKAIADVVRERIAVQKTVAEEEEAIKDLRAVADASRKKDVVIITAEAEAQESLVKEIKAAEASEHVARFAAKEKLTLANADLEASDREAQAQIRLAEGTQAEAAAQGLGAVKVREADAHAIEKQGLAEAKVTLEKMQAIAIGEEKQGMAKVTVKEADAAAVEKQGLAQAIVTKEQLLAEAVGDEQKGTADARVKEAHAVAIEKTGLAEATAIREKLTAEATGLRQKADAMKQLDGVGREHEEFRLNLDKAKEVELKAIQAKKEIAEAQAEILSNAFKQAKINIVGGDGAFFDQFIKAVTIGQSIDGLVNNSDSAKTILADYLEGNSSLPNDLREVLSRPALSAESIQSLSISALIGRLMVGADKPIQAKLTELIDKAKKLGIDELSPS